jgi:crotonobetainyl-CoA:carnitine CoA-transferase CaiB-like acyl-CoA transferase
VAEGSEAPGESFFQWAARLFDPANRHAKPEALRGIRVLDLSVIIFGPATAEYTLLLYHGSREVRERLGGMDIAVSVYTFVPVKDGWAFIAGYTDPNFGAICRIMGRPELAQDPRFRRRSTGRSPTSEPPCATRSRAGR